MASIGILGVIVGKLRYGKKLCRIILLKVNKGSEVNFYHSILLFSLTVCLQVESGGESLLNAKEIT